MFGVNMLGQILGLCKHYAEIQLRGRILYHCFVKSVFWCEQIIFALFSLLSKLLFFWTQLSNMQNINTMHVFFLRLFSDNIVISIKFSCQIQGVHQRVCFMTIIWQALKSCFSLFLDDFCFLYIGRFWYVTFICSLKMNLVVFFTHVL